MSKTLREPKRVWRTITYPAQHRLAPTAATPAREAIMLFDASTKYGGWVDRVKGMISVCELANITRRGFRICTDSTFPLLRFLEPNDVDWRSDRMALQWNPLRTRFHVSRDRPSDRFERLMHDERPQLYIDTNIDYLASLHPGASSEDLRTLWGALYRQLFRLRPELEADVRAASIAGAIAVHARFTSLLGDFRDVSRAPLEPVARTALIDQCITRLRRLSAEHDEVIVFSDSRTFLDAASTAAANVHVLPGVPAHIDHTEDQQSTLRKTLVDFHVMTRCTQVFQLRIGPMYDSAFSRYAACVQTVPYTVISAPS